MSNPNPANPYDTDPDSRQPDQMSSVSQIPSAPPPAYYPPNDKSPIQLQVPPNGGPAYYTTTQPPPGFQSANGNTTIYVEAVQPVYVVTALQNPPPDYLVLSIINFVFCCWIFGLVAIIKSVHARSAIQMGNRELAVAESRDARKWNIVSLIFGAVVWIAIVIIIIVAAVVD